MKRSLGTVSVLFLAIRLFGDIASDYAALTAGITNVPGSGGTPGTVIMHGRNAFPVFTANTNGTAPVAAAGWWNDDTNSGRGLAYSHTGWASTNGNNGLALSNAVRWAARGKPDAVIGLGGSMPAASWFTAQGYTTKSLTTTMTSTNNDFTGVDVALISMHSGYSSNALFKAMAFLTNGGGILVFSTPWALSTTAFADANNLLVNLGLGFSGDYGSGGPFTVSPTPYPTYVSALNGLDLLLAQRNGTTNVSVATQQAAADGIDGVLAVRPLFPALTNGLAQLLATYGGFISINAGRPLTKASAPIESLCERYQAGLFDLTPAAQLPKHPDADDFPGAVPTSAVVVNRTVIVQGNAPPDDPALINQGSHGVRQPIGLYARAGTVLRVTIPADKMGAGLRIQIGHQQDENFNLATWHRHPKVTRYEPLTNVVNEIASPYGGLVLVRVPPGATLGNFPITIEGAVEAPQFEQGVDSPADWPRLKTLGGAAGYIRASNFTAYVSRDALQGVADAQRVADFWGNTMKTSDYYLGYLNRFREEAGMVDRDIIAGYGHAGYPVVMAYGLGDDTLVNGVVSGGDWGFYHELGHTFQDDGHGWSGTGGGEVDVNLNPNLLMTLVHKRSLWDNNTHTTMDASSRATDRAAYFASTNTWADIRGGGTSAPYDFYFNLVESFGYDLWRRAFSRFYRWSTNNASEPSFAGLDIYNRWFVAMCEESGYNLTPYFDNWRWPVNATNKARFTASPTWSSNRPPASLNLPAPFTLGEATPPGTLVATFTTTDPDPGNLFIYSILSGNEDGAFTLDRWSGELRVASLDYERKSNYVLTITVFDNALPRYFLTNTLSITITNVAEPPVLTAPLLVASNTMAIGTALGSVTATAEFGRTIASYGLVSGGPIFAINAANGQITLQQPASLPNPGVLQLSVRATDSGGLSATSSVSVLCNSARGLLEERWTGTAMSGVPSISQVLSAFPTASVGDNYVRRLSAWLVPPTSGLYTFWIASDDGSALYLGSNALRSSAQLLASVSGYTAVGAYDNSPSQKSATLLLEAGQFYYFEVLHSESGGSDHVEVAWQGPGISRVMIPGTNFVPFSAQWLVPNMTGPPTGAALRLGTNAASEQTLFVAPGPFVLNADIQGNAAAVTNLQFLANGSVIGTDTTFPFSANWSGVTPGAYVLQGVARDTFGNVLTSPARAVTVLASVTTNLLVPTNGVWRYHNLNQDLGTAWRETNYNDSTWASGPARIGFGGDGEVTSIDIGPSTARYPTVYFRRTVNITNLARYIGFTMAIARDDGAVAYVNGMEVFRTGMNAGVVTFTTPGINATDEQTFYPTNLPPSVFVEGTNTVAVEVHQVNATSGDLGFAMRLEGAFTTPGFSVAITDPAPGGTLTLPGGPVLGGWGITTVATTPAGTITNQLLRVNGGIETNVYGPDLLFFYRRPGQYTLDVIAQNSAGQSVTSAPITVTVVSNAAPLVSITYPSLFQNLLATNTIFLRANASDPDGAVTSVEMFLDNVSLGVLNQPPFTWLWQPVVGNHQLSARVRDNTGGVGLAYAAPFTVSAQPYATNLTLVASNGLWKYNDEGIDVGTGWTNVFYNESAWSNGLARLGFGGDGEVTTLRGQPRVTYYFRKQFFVPAGFSGSNVVVKLSRDDGAIVYLNGMEIVRDNMPAGAVSYSTRPSAVVNAPSETTFYTFTTNAAALRVGTNVIAAEVHQIDATSSDIGFNLEFSSTGAQTPVNSPAPALNFTSLSSTQLRISFQDVDGVAYAVEGSTNLPVWFPITTNIVSGGTFQFIANPANPPAEFFRLRRVP